jgi:hypothetical protein
MRQLDLCFQSVAYHSRMCGIFFDKSHRSSDIPAVRKYASSVEDGLGRRALIDSSDRTAQEAWGSSKLLHIHQLATILLLRRKSLTLPSHNIPKQIASSHQNLLALKLPPLSLQMLHCNTITALLFLANNNSVRST